MIQHFLQRVTSPTPAMGHFQGNDHHRMVELLGTVRSVRYTLEKSPPRSHYCVDLRREEVVGAGQALQKRPTKLTIEPPVVVEEQSVRAVCGRYTKTVETEYEVVCLAARLNRD